MLGCGNSNKFWLPVSRFGKPCWLLSTGYANRHVAVNRSAIKSQTPFPDPKQHMSTHVNPTSPQWRGSIQLATFTNVGVQSNTRDLLRWRAHSRTLPTRAPPLTREERKRIPDPRWDTWLDLIGYISLIGLTVVWHVSSIYWSSLEN